MEGLNGRRGGCSGTMCLPSVMKMFYIWIVVLVAQFCNSLKILQYAPKGGFSGIQIIS